MKINFLSTSKKYWKSNYRLNSLLCTFAALREREFPQHSLRKSFSFKQYNQIFISALFIFFIFALNVSAQTPITVANTVKLTPEEVRLQDFDKVWKTVNEKHFDPTFGGVDWQKVRETYEPLARAAKTDMEFYGILQKMLGELHQSHFAIAPPNSEISADSFSAGEIGIDLQIIDKETVITRVESQSSAEASGLKTGFVIDKIDGKTISEILAPLEERLKNRKDTEAIKMLYRNRTLLRVISGNIGTSVKLDVLDANNKPQLVHSLNGSSLALPRIVACLLENHQEESTIKLPKPLHQYFGSQSIM